MFINKRPYQVNHIQNKVNYIYLKKLNNNNILSSRIKYFSNNNKLEMSGANLLLNDDYAFFINDSLFEQKEDNFEEKVKILEQQPPKFFRGESEDIDNLNNIYNFLYHGIRFQNHLEKLEGIFKYGAVLAGNYQDNYYSYSDNCNEGEYISLACIEDDYDLVYKTFIMPNISLIISSKCNAIKTIYLPFEEWEMIHNKNTKNRYSYVSNEYQVKQIIPLNLVKGIGLPVQYLYLTNQSNKVEIYLNGILKLMKKYNIDLPIVDTSDYNKILYLPKNYIPNCGLKRIK